MSATGPYYAIYLMIISALSFTFMDSIVKYLESVSPYQMVFFRALGSLVLCMGYLWIKGIPMFGNNKTWLILRGVVGTISMTLFFMAIKLIPIGSAVTLRYLSPIFAAVLALLFLGERIKKMQWIFFLLAFFGAALLKGFDFRISTLGFVLILGSALFSGMVYAIIKKIGGSEHPLVIVGYFMMVATVAGLLMSLPDWESPPRDLWLPLASLGVFGFFGQLFMTLALQKDDLVRVIPFKYAEAVLVVFVGFIWFGEGFGFIALFGILMIIVGMVSNVIYSNKERLANIK